MKFQTKVKFKFCRSLSASIIKKKTKKNPQSISEKKIYSIEHVKFGDEALILYLQPVMLQYKKQSELWSPLTDYHKANQILLTAVNAGAAGVSEYSYRAV